MHAVCNYVRIFPLCALHAIILLIFHLAPLKCSVLFCTDRGTCVCLHADLAPLKCSVLVLTEGPACVESVSVGEIKL